MSAKLCIMTAYADETLTLLNILEQQTEVEGFNRDEKWVVMQSGMGKVRAASM